MRAWSKRHPRAVDQIQSDATGSLRSHPERLVPSSGEMNTKGMFKRMHVKQSMHGTTEIKYMLTVLAMETNNSILK